MHIAFAKVSFVFLFRYLPTTRIDIIIKEEIVNDQVSSNEPEKGSADVG